jgi:hypothetical protein
MMYAVAFALGALIFGTAMGRAFLSKLARLAKPLAKALAQILVAILALAILALAVFGALALWGAA